MLHFFKVRHDTFKQTFRSARFTLNFNYCMTKSKSHIITRFFRKLHLKELFTIAMVLVAIFFFRQQRHELQSLGTSLKTAHSFYLVLGIVFTAIYILLQSLLYVYSFKAVKGNIKLISAVELFLKRNVISVFLPAGAISSLAYLPKNIKRQQVHKHQVHQASAIYGFIGTFSVFIVGIPVILYMAIHNSSIPGTTVASVIMVLIMITAVLLFRAIRAKGKTYHWIIKTSPKAEHFINEVFSFDLSMKDFWRATITSILIEVTGIIHLYIAMLAIGTHLSLEAAITGYIVATIFLMISPFMRGLGAVELSLTLILQKYGYTTLEAVGITLLFRLFEFWLPLLIGLFSFAAKGRQLFFRLLPPVMIFVLGMVNIISVLTPPNSVRLETVRTFFTTQSIQASNLFVILIGLTLIVTAAYLVRGLRSAWILALSLSILSCCANLVKALDYGEALLSLVVIIVLLATVKEYRLKSNSRLLNIGLVTGFATFAAVLLFGTIAFYYLDQRHFHNDFAWRRSFEYAFNTFFLINDANLKPYTKFASEFLFFIKMLGIGSWVFMLYCIIRPGIYKNKTEKANTDEVQFLLKQFGDSPLDHFKIGKDKSLFISEVYEGFVSYRATTSFAVVLEEPVCAEENKVSLIIEFEDDCKHKGLKPVYYRVDEDSLYYFKNLGRKKILIGQEALMDITGFSLEGKDKKSLRNALNSLQKKGYEVKVLQPPLPGHILQGMQQVSDEWLQTYDMEEATFSQGAFDRQELRDQVAVLMMDQEQRIVGFLNLVPDYHTGECTYDLIRKTADAPGGCMDALIIELVQWGKRHNYQFLNLGMVPMSGIEQPDNAAEQVVKFAYEKIKRFKTYHGLRSFKEKYATEWLNKYLVYENDFDLIQIPVALNKVMHPPAKA